MLSPAYTPKLAIVGRIELGGLSHSFSKINLTFSFFFKFCFLFCFWATPLSAYRNYSCKGLEGTRWGCQALFEASTPPTVPSLQPKILLFPAY